MNEKRIENLRNVVEQKKGEKSYLKKQLKEERQTRKQNIKDLRSHEKALEVIKLVGKKMQEKLQYHISDITSLAMEAVLDNPYKLSVDFVERRNKIECDLLFQDESGNKIDPLSASGGGAVDVAAFALRIASWSMQQPKTQNTIILDEPFRFLDKSKHDKASEMIKELSKKLGIQFIIVTHEEKLTEAADRVFSVSKKGKISSVKQV